MCVCVCVRVCVRACVHMYDILSVHDVTFIPPGMCGIRIPVHTALYPLYPCEEVVSHCGPSLCNKELEAAACPGVFQRHPMPEVIREAL